MVLPTFIIIGAAKSGTSALHSYLQQHPQVYMSRAKETNFFAWLDTDEPAFDVIPRNAQMDRREESRIRYNKSKDRSVKSWAEYEDLFAAVHNEVAVGESSPFYLYNPECAGRIRKHLPNARLIAVLRNPIDRAYSHLLHYRRDGIEKHETMDAALADEDISVEDVWWGMRHYVRAGFYSKQVQRYYDQFPEDQLLVLLYDDLKKDTAGTIRQIFGHIGVDTTFQPETSARHNVSGIPKNRYLHELLSRPNQLKQVLKKVLPDGLRTAIAGSEFVSRLRMSNLKRDSLPQETRVRLKEVYVDDILELQDILHRDLSVWLI